MYTSEPASSVDHREQAKIRSESSPRAKEINSQRLSVPDITEYQIMAQDSPAGFELKQIDEDRQESGLDFLEKINRQGMVDGFEAASSVTNTEMPRRLTSNGIPTDVLNSSTF